MKSLFGINIGGGYCGLCGHTLNPINSIKVGNGFICNKCLSFASRFIDKKRMGYEAMLQHINQRQEQLIEIKNFQPVYIYGEKEFFFFDETCNRFVISSGKDITKSDTDIFLREDILSCKKCIVSHKKEVMYKDSNGNTKSFVPKYMAYSYDFFVEIELKSNVYQRISVKLNKGRIDNNQETLVDMKSSRLLSAIKDLVVDKSYDGNKTNNKDEVEKSSEYISFNEMADKIIECLRNGIKTNKIIRCPYCKSILREKEIVCSHCGAFQ